MYDFEDFMCKLLYTVTHEKSYTKASKKDLANFCLQINLDQILSIPDLSEIFGKPAVEA